MTTTANTLPPRDDGSAPKLHPLEDYLTNVDRLVHTLVIERQRQADRAQDLRVSAADRAQASAIASELSSKVDLMAAQRNAFMVGLVTGRQGPSPALAAASRAMAAKLGEAVAAANRPAALLGSADRFLAAATQLLKRNANPPSPPPGAPAPAPAGSASAAPAPAGAARTPR